MLLTLEQKAHRAREKNLIRVRRYRDKHPDRLLASTRKQEAAKPKALRARELVRNELKRGRMTRGCCEIPGCGKKRTHGHHDDYDRPLKVRWLCPVHHREWHDANGPGANLESPDK